MKRKSSCYSENYSGFLRKDLSPYAGMWIAMKGGKVIERGATSGKLVSKLAGRSDLPELTISMIPNKKQIMIL